MSEGFGSDSRQSTGLDIDVEDSCFTGYSTYNQPAWWKVEANRPHLLKVCQYDCPTWIIQHKPVGNNSYNSVTQVIEYS